MGGVALGFAVFLGREKKGVTMGDGGSPGSPLRAVSPTASAQAGSAPRTEPEPVPSCTAPAEPRHRLSAAPANPWGAASDPGGEEGGRAPHQLRIMWAALGTSRKGAGWGLGGLARPARRLARLPGPPPPDPQDLLGRRRDGNERLCCCLTHPDLIDFFPLIKDH